MNRSVAAGLVRIAVLMRIGSRLIDRQVDR